jgi:hypothetical protein
LNKRHHYVIDGQQRVTTVAVFFSCLIEEGQLRERNGEVLVDLEGSPVQPWRWKERYLVWLGMRRFRTVAADDEFFDRAFIQRLPTLQPDPARHSQKRLLHAQQVFKQAFAAKQSFQINTLNCLV